MFRLPFLSAAKGKWMILIVLVALLLSFGWPSEMTAFATAMALLYSASSESGPGRSSGSS